VEFEIEPLRKIRLLEEFMAWLDADSPVSIYKTMRQIAS
jgi:hypothetical protein